MDHSMDSQAEWLETDGLGGFASGTVNQIRTRRYHALLLAAAHPPTDRFILVNGLEVGVETEAGTFALTSHRYDPDVLFPDGVKRLHHFEPDPWPRWTFRLEDGGEIEQELFVKKGTPLTAIRWISKSPGKKMTLSVRPLISGRDYHSLHRENSFFKFSPVTHENQVEWKPYPGVPGIVAYFNGAYFQEPEWFKNFAYTREKERGLDYTEDLASPGVFRFDLDKSEAVLVLSTSDQGGNLLDPVPLNYFNKIAGEERARRQSFSTRLHRSAADYLVARDYGKTILAGYPWFTDWGRDTFISIRGLCLAAGRLEEASSIVLGWADKISQGMLPNRFPDQGELPEYNSVDASLWYVVAVAEFLKRKGRELPQGNRIKLLDTVDAILSHYAKGTRYGIQMDSDFLLQAGEPGSQLTWMDAKANGIPVTPRVGKPVEVQALWLNALFAMRERFPQWHEPAEEGLSNFRIKFWNASLGGLYDVVDVNHQKDQKDATLRPNQILAAGGLPLNLLSADQTRQVVDQVESVLWTPSGLRSLSPQDPAYQSTYKGNSVVRDTAYHQGTVWPWLAGPFIEAWVRARGSTPEVKQEARQKFLEPFLAQGASYGLAHLPEITDGESPFTPRGCPFQAWSVGEALRLSQEVLL
jgi:predicted glycogen debranching enzyme